MVYVPVQRFANIGAYLVPFFKVHIVVVEGDHSFFGDKAGMEGAEDAFGLESFYFSCGVGVGKDLHVFIVLRVDVPRLFPGCHVLIVPDRVVGNCLGA